MAIIINKKILSFATLFLGVVFAVQVLPQTVSAGILAKPGNSLGLIGYWPMAGTGTTIWDVSGNGNHGSLNSGAIFSTTIAKFGGALDLRNGSDYGEIPDAATLTPGGGTVESALSIAFWLYTATPTGVAVMSKGTGATTGEYSVLFNSNSNIILRTIDQTVGMAIGRRNTSIFPSNAFTHVVVTYDGSASSAGMNIYINGVATTTAVDNTGSGTYVRMRDTTDTFRFGSRGGGLFMDGVLDDIRLYNRALSANEVSALYNAYGGVARITPAVGTTAVNASQNGELADGLVSLLSFNGPDISGTTATDRSGQGNNGSISGASPSIGKVGQALRFDGVDDTVLVSDAAVLDIGTSDFTTSAWIRGNSMANSDIIFGKSAGGAASATYGFLFGVFDSLYPTLYFATSASSHAKIQAASTPLSNNEWYHIAISVDRDNSSNTLVYVNGAAVATTVTDLASHTGSISNAESLSVGSESDGGFNWDGVIDEVRFYNRALSAAEIRRLYNLGR